ncbi:MAG: DNA polymerase I [Clostridia bacterium]|nr:DNA polymerase I [Clostridia bacterium]
MRFLVIDGNSIVNRAFYGIKLLTTKDGRYTNAIQGFMNILLSLKNEYNPDRVAVAFDMKAPTFRHKMYSEYKAGRKGMPEELHQQMPVLKSLLTALGYKIVECEGWEADDILGTISHACTGDDKCFIATGDRDSLQLISDNSTVLLATSKGTVVFDKSKLFDEYGVEPYQMIELKALQGDSSDNIPGIPGVGPKTAGDLIKKFGTVQYIYDNIDTIDVKEKLREKLIANKDLAFLSKDLGTIRLDAPICLDFDQYKIDGGDEREALKILSSLEMFKLIEKIRLNTDNFVAEIQESDETIEIAEIDSFSEVEKAKNLYFIFDYDDGEIVRAIINNGKKIFVVKNESFVFASELSSIFLDESIEKTVYNVKLLYEWAFRHGFELKGKINDTMLAGYLLNPTSSDYLPSRLALEYSAPVPKAESEDALIKEAAAMPPLWEKILYNIEENQQAELLWNIEIPFAKVLASMEVKGFLVDRQGIIDYGEELQQKINALRDEIYELAGEEFNINSPKQLGEILFVKLKLPAKKKTKSGYSTSADVLDDLADSYPIVASVLEYRTLAKLKSTYCEGLVKEIAPDGRIRSTLNQTETRTGRISSAEPNLQNIPVRTTVGKEMRKFFTAPEGSKLVDSDYSQIELRVLAHIADDKAMIDAFNNNADIHTITAAQVFNMPVEFVTPAMRSKAKAVNFGIVYGIGAFSLAKDIKVTRKEADSYIKGYLSLYSGIDEYMKSVAEKAKQDGYVSTIFGRRRYLPELNSTNFNMRSFGERVARNMPIQGTAADIIKIAMIKVYERLKAEKLKAEIIMQVHDEIIVEAPDNEVELVQKIVCEEMENACQMKVRLVADAHSGQNWYEAKGE